MRQPESSKSRSLVPRSSNRSSRIEKQERGKHVESAIQAPHTPQKWLELFKSLFTLPTPKEPCREPRAQEKKAVYKPKEIDSNTTYQVYPILY